MFNNNVDLNGREKNELVTIFHPRVVASTFCVLAVASVQFFCHPSVDMVIHLEENIFQKTSRPRFNPSKINTTFKL